MTRCSGAQANLGHYSNRTLDLLLERARVEPDVTARLRMYDRAQRMIVGDAAAIFLAHDESLTLVSRTSEGMSSPRSVCRSCATYRCGSTDPSPPPG